MKIRKDTINRIRTNIVRVFSFFVLYPAFPRGQYCSKRIRQLGPNADRDYAHFLSHLLSAAKTERRKDTSFSFWQKK